MSYIKGNLIVATQVDQSLVGTLVSEPQARKNVRAFSDPSVMIVRGGVTLCGNGLLDQDSDERDTTGYQATQLSFTTEGDLQFCLTGNPCIAQSVMIVPSSLLSMYSALLPDVDVVASAFEDAGINILNALSFGASFPGGVPHGFSSDPGHSGENPFPPYESPPFREKYPVCGKILDYRKYAGQSYLAIDESTVQSIPPSHYDVSTIEHAFGLDYASRTPPEYESTTRQVCNCTGTEFAGSFFGFRSDYTNGNIGKILGNGEVGPGKVYDIAIVTSDPSIEFCRDFFGLDG